MRLKKGSKEAKEYMASIRAKKAVSGAKNQESDLLVFDLQRRISNIAGKLINEGLTSSTYTKAKAKQLTKNVAAPVYVRKMIDSFSPEIVKEMKLLESDSLSGWKKGSTRLIERGEKPVKGAKNIRVTRRQKPDVFGQKGTFKNFAKIGVLNKPQILDEVAAREIQIFLDNDRELYLKMKLPILKALQKKYSKGIYNIDSAAKIWQKYIEAGMVKYNKTFGNKYSKWFDLLSVSDRKLLALEYAKETLMEFNEGNFEF
jgi:hypothetical protein